LRRAFGYLAESPDTGGSKSRGWLVSGFWEFREWGKDGVADLRYESSFVEFLKPRLKLTFGYVKSWYSYLDSATPI
jgi:hypothetical protein